MTISDALRAKVRAQAGNRCGYCLARQEYVPWVLEIEHIVPKSKGGADDEENLWLACHSCNLFKPASVPHSTNDGKLRFTNVPMYQSTNLPAYQHRSKAKCFTHPTVSSSPS
jgi:HNH endonuclease